MAAEVMDRRRAVAVLASMASFCGGCSFGWLSPYYSHTGASQTTISTMGSLYCLGGSIGTPLFGIITRKWGAKNGMLVAAIPLMISWIMKIWYRSTTTIIISRIVAGLGSSGSMMLTPLYLDDIFNGKCTGKSMIMSFTFANFGVLFAFVMYETAKYDIFLWTSLCTVVLHFVIFVWMPESPIYLMKSGRVNEAVDAVCWLKKIPTIQGQNYCREILQDSNQQMSIRPSHYKIGALCIVLFSIQSLGYCTVGRSSQIFKFAAPTWPQGVSSVILASFQMFGSLVSMATFDKWGHKILFATSTVIFSFGMAAMAIYDYFVENGARLYEFIPLLFLSLSLMAYSIGMQTMPFIIVAKTFSIEIKSAIGLVFITWTWLTTCIVTQFYHNLTTNLEMYVVYLIFASVSAIACVTYFFTSKVKKKRTNQLSVATNQSDKINSDAMNALL